MKAIQYQLNFPAPAASKTHDAAKSEKKLQVKGRPRRLTPLYTVPREAWDRIYSEMRDKGIGIEEALEPYAVPPYVIKISLTPDEIRQIDRARKKIEGNATIPDFVRLAVERMLSRDSNQEQISIRTNRKIQGRCQYIKVLFEPVVVEQIGHLEDGSLAGCGLCGKYGVSRQKLIASAVLDYLESLR